MYPNITTDLDYTVPNGQVFDTKPQIQKISQKEKDCKQFLPKSAKLTKDFLDKVYISKLAKPETYVFRDEWRTSSRLIIAGIFLLFLTSFYGIIFMWYTEGFNKIIYSKLVISEGSPASEMWKNPTPKPLINIYIFNYTNVDAFEDGTDAKLQVEELGPYVYEETMKRVNVEYNGSYVSFRYNRSYRFVPELSKGRPSDIVVVPNILMLAISSQNKYSNFFTRLTIAGALNSIRAKPFVTLTAHRFIVGYDDKLYSLAKSLMKFQDKKPAEQMGFLSNKVGVGQDVYTIDTGLNDIDQIGTVKTFNGQNQLDFWNTPECNSITGAELSSFSPNLVKSKKPLKMFLKEFCRTIDLVYKEDRMLFDGRIPSYRYQIPEDMFDSAAKNPKNQCFCELDGGTCALQGTFNATQCSMGAPMFLSFPHFYKADPSLVNAINGLHPNNRPHENYFDLHPTLGFPMNVRTTVQLNVQVMKPYGFSQLDKYEDGLILPIAWMDLRLEDKYLPEEMKDLISTATFTVAFIEKLLKYGCIIIALVTLIPIVANIRYRMTRHQRTNSVRPLQKSEINC